VLATAALLPERVIAAASLSSPGPYDAEGLDWYAGQGEDNVNEHQTAARGRDPLVEMLDPPRRAMLAAVPDDMAREMRSLLSEIDTAEMTGERAAYLLAATQHGLEHGVDGWVDDDRAFVTPWGFDLNDIKVPVLLLHGEHDQFVPAAHGRWLAERIPGVQAEISAQDGHLTLLTRRFRDVHEWLIRQ
jgi:pimeloyl-ACP methyl ester carboxylesterase